MRGAIAKLIVGPNFPAKHGGIKRRMFFRIAGDNLPLRDGIAHVVHSPLSSIRPKRHRSVRATFTSSIETPRRLAICRESNLRPWFESRRTAAPLQRMRLAMRRIDFHVMERLPRWSWESVECSISSDRANARNE